jgi:hypothetical protein
MNVQTFDVYAFYDAETVEEAIKKMRRAVGKKHEAAAVKFARTMLELDGKKITVENEAVRKRYDLLYALYKIYTVKNQIQKTFKFATDLAAQVYSEYTDLGGGHWEEEAYRTGKTKKEVIDEAYSKPASRLIDTKDEQKGD